MANGQIRRILIVGGGTAGWLTAAVLASRFPRREGQGMAITLVESPSVPTIGVGEGSWPTLRSTLRGVGISEFDFLKACDAAFKQGSEFRGWLHGGEERYLHPFTAPLGWESWGVIDAWRPDSGGGDFAHDLSFQAALCDQSLAPRPFSAREYQAPANYAYHFDAGKLGALLADHAVRRLQVEHIRDDVTEAVTCEDGRIAALNTQAGRRLEADLFVDCTGLAARLVGDKLGAPFVSLKGQLFNDRALAVQVPYADPAAPVASVTRATAWAKGWIWDIGLGARRGVGCVYSSGHADEVEAEAALRAYLARTGVQAEGITPRALRFEPGYRPTPFVGNAVAVGLSAGFVEPLEASAIVMIEMAAKDLAEGLPRTTDALPLAAARFNAAAQARWAGVVEFLKLHYAISRRSDSDYWRDHRRAETQPDGFPDRLALFAQRAPHRLDLPRADELFSASSYHYVLNGMSFERAENPAFDRPDLALTLAEKIAETREQAKRMVATLPTHRQYLQNLARFEAL
ncbi:tryptophan halogenase family protein [Phenylobacterium montanum]|uniref:Tryptophan 7-halogenase n=1 Tax=Phenylobacterium montanum TaxID=2823693 RepID=A0A975G3D0_9CAUL|nr:tryptophan halogenase family protein [Caulobacter sp. S6]QUD89799.1 tryptophan 7-halogenase [Caulobacter sp. S6]